MKFEFGSARNYLEVKKGPSGGVQIILACPSAKDSTKLVVNMVEISQEEFNNLATEILYKKEV